MKLRRFMLLVSTLWLITFAAESTRAMERRPNFILILADNLGYGDIGCFGSTKHRTPNIDRLATEGVLLTSFYSTSPVCTSSRASFMTGCYPRRVNMHVDYNGVQVLVAVSPRGLNPDEVTVAEYLKRLGYVTACVGKWHLGDQPPFLPTKHGFDSFFGLPYSEDMTERPARRHAPAYPPLPLLENETVIEAPPDRALLTKRFTERSIQFIQQNKDRPFFLYLPHTIPGSTATSFASEAFRGKSANGTYGDAVEELDWSTGEILKALRSLEIDDKTLVIWTSDNGAILRQATINENRRAGRDEHYGLGSSGPLRGSAYSTDEGGMRMPFVARWPGKIPAGASCDEVTTAMDLLPTIVQLAGGQVATDPLIDGKNIWPLMAGLAGSKSPHEGFYYYYLSQLQAVRSGKWKLYLPLNEKWIRFTGESVASELKLFNLREDLAENHNLAAQHPQTVQRLLAAAEHVRDQLGDLRRPGKGQRPAGFYANPRPLWFSKVELHPE